jgi:osmotically-inducible protein OsmY
MRTNILFASPVALALAMIVPGCTSSPKQESTGEYIDSSSITAKVKAAMFAEPGLRSMQIGVETYKDEVQLSGFVNSALTKSRAESVALGVPGVQSVRNDLVVK